MKNDSSKYQRFAAKIPFDFSVGLVTTFVSGIVSGLFLFGFSYTREYLTSFGLSPFEINITYHAAAAHGTSLIVDNKLYIGLFLVLILMSIVVSWARNKFGNLGFWIPCALFFIFICVIAVYAGKQYATKEALAVMTGAEGISAYCKLTSSSSISKQIKKSFEAMTREGRTRKVIETRDMVYFTFIVEQNELELAKIRANSFAIKKTDIEHCRFFAGR